MIKRRQKYKLKVPSVTDNLQIIRKFVINIAEKAGFAEEEQQQIALADLVVLAVEAGEGEAKQAEEQLASLPAGKPYILVANKVDQLTEYQASNGWVGVSAIQEVRLEEFRTAIAEKLGFGGFEPEQPLVFTRRQYELLQKALAYAKAKDLLKTLHSMLQQKDTIKH